MTDRTALRLFGGFKMKNQKILNLLCDYAQAGYDKSDKYDTSKCDKLKARWLCYEFGQA